MLDIKFVRDNISTVEAGLKKRGQDGKLEDFTRLEARRREILPAMEELRHERKTVSQQIGQQKKQGKDASEEQARMREVGDRIKEMEKELSQVEQDLEALMLSIPNLPHESVPEGIDDTENRLEKTVGTPPEFDFEPQAHWDIGENLGILDFARAARITGSRFPLYFGAGAQLERACINFMLNWHTVENDFTEVLPPFIVNRQSMTATGQLPKFEEDLFKLENWDYYLIPTAEVPVTNIHASEIMDESDLPVYYAAYTPCFRAEAGAHGKDTRGLIRQHQFNKVEMVKFVKPENSWDELETLLRSAESILEALGLAYRTVTLCSGDLGFSASKTYDIEVWMPAQNTYREISSCSNFTDYQARRGNIRFRRQGKKGTEFVHTLNGSGLAVGRTVAAILENFQQADGSVKIPEALVPYMGGREVITK